MIVAQVPDKNIPEVFARVKHLLEKALDRGLGEFHIEDIFASIYNANYVLPSRNSSRFVVNRVRTTYNQEMD